MCWSIMALTAVFPLSCSHNAKGEFLESATHEILIFMGVAFFLEALMFIVFNKAPFVPMTVDKMRGLDDKTD